MQCDISPTDKALRARMIQVHIFLEEETQPFAEPNLEGAKLTNIASSPPTAFTGTVGAKWKCSTGEEA